MILIKRVVTSGGIDPDLICVNGSNTGACFLARGMATVQFDHRLLAWALALAVPLLWWRIRRHPAAPRAARTGASVLLALLVLQVALGISTLLLRVPVTLAAMHQAGAVLLFAAALNVAHALRRRA